jgi:hypothetical protein
VDSVVVACAEERQVRSPRPLLPCRRLDRSFGAMYLVRTIDDPW